MTSQKIPCPLTDEQCADIDRILATNPQVAEMVADCAECGITIPGAAEGLAKSTEMLTKLRGKVAKWKANAAQGA